MEPSKYNVTVPEGEMWVQLKEDVEVIGMAHGQHYRVLEIGVHKQTGAVLYKIDNFGQHSAILAEKVDIVNFD